jgi:hypothetical protein
MKIRIVGPSGRRLFGAPSALLDHEDLTPAIVAAGRADVVHHVRRAAGVAVHEDRDVLEVVVPPPVSLAMPADSLLR